ncbi:MAG: hypothetical protein IT359_02105 [Gemmatimonadaceae bacterium]|nr:hypothetical protein [Gemmatimonadaceae bacterium]
MPNRSLPMLTPISVLMMTLGAPFAQITAQSMQYRSAAGVAQSGARQARGACRSTRHASRADCVRTTISFEGSYGSRPNAMATDMLPAKTLRVTPPRCSSLASP